MKKLLKEVFSVYPLWLWALNLFAMSLGLGVILFL